MWLKRAGWREMTRPVRRNPNVAEAAPRRKATRRLLPSIRGAEDCPLAERAPEATCARAERRPESRQEWLAMDQSPIELTMRVDGMTCEGCAEAVRRTIRRLDPQAEVAVDVGLGRVTATTVAQSLDVAQALTKAGYTATAMTG
ncbi:hypothetical protein GCM10008965_56260 [Methylorubrum aminovorans]